MVEENTIVEVTVVTDDGGQVPITDGYVRGRRVAKLAPLSTRGSSLGLSPECGSSFSQFAMRRACYQASPYKYAAWED